MANHQIQVPIDLEANYFDHFGIPVSFIVDAEKLRKQYLQFSKQNHPDFAAGDDAAYEQALLQTSLNNQAYKTLSSVSERIPYVLDILGQPVSKEDKLPPMFLMDMMEWNERIMDVGMSDDKSALSQVTTDFEKLEEEFEIKLNGLLEAFESSNTESLLQEIKESYLQRKYLLRIRDSINKFARL